MKLKTSLFLNFIFLVLVLFSSCENQDHSNRRIQSIPPPPPVLDPDLKKQNEITCIFATSEIARYIDLIKRKKEFDNSTFKKQLIGLNEKLKYDCDFNSFQENFVAFLISDFFKEDSKNLTLDQDFIAQKKRLIQKANNNIEAAEEVVLAIAEIIYHKENAENKVFSRSAIQRLDHINKDTIQLKKNTSYDFPTSFFINERLLNPSELVYEKVVIKGGSVIDSINKKQVEVKFTNGIISMSTPLTIFIETIE